MIFHNRKEAGQKLASKLEKFRHENPLILGIPRGGVVVAYEVAKILSAQLDVIVARKLGAPMQPEYAIGAIAPGDVAVFNEDAVKSLGLSRKDIDNLLAKEKTEMQRRIVLYRKGKKELILSGRRVIIIDDGLATGLTALAVVRFVKKAQAKEIILAVPVAAENTVQFMRKEVDEVVCLSVPEDFVAVGQFYEDFPQTTDEEVIELLNKAVINDEKR